MAKRQRGGARPGQRAPIQRGTQPAAEAGHEARARTAVGRPERRRARPRGRARGRDRRRGARGNVLGLPRPRPPAHRPRTPARPGGTGPRASLTAVAENEYRYVKRDLRRIAVVFTGIFGLLLLSWSVIVVMGVVAV